MLPDWLEMGLSKCLYYSTRVRKGVFNFNNDKWALKECRSIREKGRLTPLHELVMLDAEAFRKLYAKTDKDNIRIDVECHLAVGFLLAEKQQVPQLRGCLTRYLTALGKACVDVSIIEDPDKRVQALDAAHKAASLEAFGRDEAVWRKIDK